MKIMNIGTGSSSSFMITTKGKHQAKAQKYKKRAGKQQKKKKNTRSRRRQGEEQQQQGTLFIFF
jgi:hypothetical protein